MVFNFTYGPTIQDPYLRYTLAGTSAFMFTEVITHSIDTINIRSKLFNTSSFFLWTFFKQEGVAQLARGVQPMLYGFYFGSLVYFYSYGKLRDYLREKLATWTRWQEWIVISMSSFLAAFVAETAALMVYYPFELIKTRMQARVLKSPYTYTGTLDALLTIYAEQKGLAWYKRFSGFYRGGFHYGFAYITLLSIEFALFETILH
eukprot:CAMPEP_0202965782 /NCGR_PEP_ID=MMETSP1396-20130829/9856_1 /ASSEMBLY_ACC=CAM_ASM_000872 /TAXON_ID= /ORGANISM="Pseudokeronopsis sp., Strain Brazil" /LENGTH=203 /DNA_ID=CAMNT_0049688839 /DNA_START=59 /DNA_END=670 /DNA_ORIENTATION=-